MKLKILLNKNEATNMETFSQAEAAFRAFCVGNVIEGKKRVKKYDSLQLGKYKLKKIVPFSNAERWP